MISKKESYCEYFSYIFMALAVFVVFYFHFVAGFIAGMLVYSLTQIISNKMEEKFNLGKISNTVFIIIIAVAISTFCTVVVMGTINFAKFGVNGEGINIILLKIIDILNGVKDIIPASISSYIPETADVLKHQLIMKIEENKDVISVMGLGFFHKFASFIIGLIIGCMLSFSKIKEPDCYPPLTKHILKRLINLKNSFNLVVFAQVKISFINTVFTGVYLAVILPIFGVHLPLIKTMILITFLAGLIPVLGNILSNTILVIVSLGTSLEVAMFSLIFLIVIHKLEYFLNAKIIGDKIQAIYWELVIAIVLMEVIFGIAGAITAPIIYAYIKKECKDVGIL